MDECPDNWLYQAENYGCLILEGVGILACFYAMMLLTDKFLMECIEILVRKYSLTNAAGSVLVAFGSIVPEFTVNTISCLMMSSGHAALGLSTIIGSGCFDFTICLAVASLIVYWKHGSLNFNLMKFAGIYAWYIIDLFILLAIIADGQVSILEAGLLFALTPAYLLYIFTVEGKVKVEHSPELKDNGPLIFSNPFLRRVADTCEGSIKKFIPKTEDNLSLISGKLAITILGSFVITRCTVFLMQRVTCHIPVSDALLGLTIMAWGNNIGDIMNSATAAKRGNAELSMLSVISTQVLNIHCSLGLPWALTALLYGDFSVGEAVFLYSLLFVMGIVTLSYIAMILAKQAMNLSLSVMLGSLYILYIVVECTVLLRLKVD
mmetsp:Transcript_26618/g.47876  ORF Transcript_26618/g.47876 Transcript_26618/m.47876 type:complete len:378 (-) Transcript_26618:1770-2903(-)